MNIKLREVTNSDIDYLNDFGLKINPKCKVIMLDDNRVGVVEFTKYNGSIYLSYISIHKNYRRRGIGKKTVELLKEYGDIFGDCSPQHISISFWTNLNVEFDVSEEEINEYILYKQCIPFVLYA